MPSTSAMELLKQGLNCGLVLLDWKPGFQSELVARLGESRDGREPSTVGLLFLWSSLAFLEAHAISHEGIPAQEYQSEDGWSSLDFLENLSWEVDRLRVQMNVVRGRQVTTEISISREGLFVVRTHGRGDSPLRWFESFSD